MKATRGGPLFAAFPYPTKISAEAIALFIASHTKPGDIVFDGFAGSGSTGIAALLCTKPTAAMREEAKKLGLEVRWGARRAILQELGSLGSFIARTLCAPPDPDEFRLEAERVLKDCEQELEWMYAARDPKGRIGTIRYIIWSEVVVCNHCGKAATLFEGCVRRNPARISPIFRCPACSRRSGVTDVRRLTQTRFDELLQRNVTTRLRRPVWIYGMTGKTTWSRSAIRHDVALLRRISRASLPSGIPLAPIPWGDLYRNGYHRGITHLHHFYTRRNLIAFGTLWWRASASPMRDALRFWLLSYNASHATIMTRVVAKEGQRDLVVTSAQPGVLYVSGLPVEKNLLSGLKRKLKTIYDAFRLTRGNVHSVDVRQGSCLETGIPTGSIDYVFTDPPFGGNIPYAEVNFLNEAWRGEYTDAAREVTISKTQNKDVGDYQALMAQAFREIHRVLKPNGEATVVFHSSSSDVWNALSRAYGEAGFALEKANILDKTQGSFKQVTTNGAVKGDPTLLLRKRVSQSRRENGAVAPILQQLLARAQASSDRSERTPQRLYSRFVTHYLALGEIVPLDADEFYRIVAGKLASPHPHASLR